MDKTLDLAKPAKRKVKTGCVTCRLVNLSHCRDCRGCLIPHTEFDASNVTRRNQAACVAKAREEYVMDIWHQERLEERFAMCYVEIRI